MGSYASPPLINKLPSLADVPFDSNLAQAYTPMRELGYSGGDLEAMGQAMAQIIQSFGPQAAAQIFEQQMSLPFKRSIAHIQAGPEYSKADAALQGARAQAGAHERSAQAGAGAHKYAADQQLEAARLRSEAETTLQGQKLGWEQTKWPFQKGIEERKMTLAEETTPTEKSKITPTEEIFVKDVLTKKYPNSPLKQLQGWLAYLEARRSGKTSNDLFQGGPTAASGPGLLDWFKTTGEQQMENYPILKQLTASTAPDAGLSDANIAVKASRAIPPVGNLVNYGHNTVAILRALGVLS